MTVDRKVNPRTLRNGRLDSTTRPRNFSKERFLDNLIANYPTVSTESFVRWLTKACQWKTDKIRRERRPLGKSPEPEKTTLKRYKQQYNPLRKSGQLFDTITVVNTASEILIQVPEYFRGVGHFAGKAKSQEWWKSLFPYPLIVKMVYASTRKYLETMMGIKGRMRV